MLASASAPPIDAPAAARWLLLIHQLPPKPDYLRVKVRRRLRSIGAVAVKHTVYLLPNTGEALEDFHWLRQEIESEGGSAVIAEAGFVAGITDEEIHAMLTAETAAGPDAVAPARGIVDSVEPGRTWVTRENVHVDRIASAWLIRRFIDPHARFKFVAARGYKPRAGDLRFDMFDAEYTHVGDDCSFQTLAQRFGVSDRAVRALGESCTISTARISRSVARKPQASRALSRESPRRTPMTPRASSAARQCSMICTPLKLKRRP